MTTMNPFDLLGDNDNDDPSILIETVSAQLLKSAVISPKNNQPEKGAKLPTKPVPPAQAVREARNENGRGGGRGFGREGGGRGFGREGGGRGYGREGGGRGYGREGGGRGRGGYNNRDNSNNENGFNNSAVSRPQGDEGEKNTERRSYDGPYRGGRRGGYNNEEGRDGDRPRRTYERHSGTGRGNEFKREGAGRGNWGNQYDEVAPTEEVVEETEKTVSAEDVSAEDLPVVEEAKDDKEAKPDETEKKEPEEDKEMTLEEYQKVLDEKRKDLLALKPEERKVKVDKDLQSMQPLSNKKTEESIFIKLGSDKEKKKEASEKEKTKKIVSINEFLKPADGEKYYSPGGRGRGRGRGSRGGGGGGAGYEGGGGGRTSFTPAPKIKDQDQFPTLGGPRAT